MFQSKIHGHSQELLYDRLLEFYNKGIACLLHSPSIRRSLMQAILHREYVVSTREMDIVSEVRLHIEIVNEIDKMYGSLRKICSIQGEGGSFIMLASVITDFALPISPHQHVISRMFCSDIIRSIVDHLSGILNNKKNRQKVEFLKSCEQLLKISVRFGCLSDVIYLALFHCVTGENQKALRILEKLKRALFQPYVIYNGRVNRMAYRQKVVGQSLQEKMKKAASMDLMFPKRCMLIQELTLEKTVTTQLALCISPYIMTLMMLIVCNHDNSQKQQEVLRELYILVHNEDERYIDKSLRDISWQILGICQQICGDHRGALRSYQESLKQEPYNGIQEASYRRIQDARSRI